MELLRWHARIVENIAGRASLWTVPWSTREHESKVRDGKSGRVFWGGRLLACT